MKYYAMIDGERRGPFSLEELPKAGVRPSTYIWHKGMADWEKAGDIPDVCRLYRNRLYDLMHPAALQENLESSSKRIEPGKTNTNDQNPEQQNRSISRFDSILQKNGSQPLPTLDEIDNKINTAVPPASMIYPAWIVTLICFPPTGVVALYWAYKSRKTWIAGENKLAYDCCRAAKMWTGISFFMGLILYAFLFRFVL